MTKEGSAVRRKDGENGDRRRETEEVDRDK